MQLRVACGGFRIAKWLILQVKYEPKYLGVACGGYIYSQNCVLWWFFEVYSVLAVDVTSTCNSEVFWLIIHLKYEPFVQHMTGAEI